MRQLWPLNRASLETGPFFPFDNGPNGVNTLVAPQWLTRWVPSQMLIASSLYCKDQAFHVWPLEGADALLNMPSVESGRLEAGVRVSDMVQPRTACDDRP